MKVKELTHSPQGFELTLAANHVGHFLLTNLILAASKAKKNKTPRVVNVTSLGHRIGPFRFDDPNFAAAGAYDGWSAYGQSKTANILYSIALARRGVVRILAPPGRHLRHPAGRPPGPVHRPGRRRRHRPEEHGQGLGQDGRPEVGVPGRRHLALRRRVLHRRSAVRLLPPGLQRGHPPSSTPATSTTPRSCGPCPRRWSARSLICSRRAVLVSYPGNG